MGVKLPISYRYFKSSGPGGQHRNKVESAVEASVTLPDGRVIRAVAQEDRSQHRNKAVAKARLLVRAREALMPEEERRRTAGWSPESRVRTYHEPDNRVVDHGSGFRQTYREVVGNLDLSEMIETRREALLDA